VTDLDMEYEMVEPSQKVPFDFLRVGQVVYICSRIYRMVRIEAVGNDWAVGRDDYDRVHLMDEDIPPWKAVRKEGQRVRIID
jgi:hypothetical protein